MTLKWRIYYSNSCVEGETEEDWNNAPNQDVQIVVVFAPYPDHLYRPWSGISDKQVWTGIDEYSINGWSIKYGKWMDKEKYFQLWEGFVNGSC